MPVFIIIPLSDQPHLIYDLFLAYPCKRVNSYDIVFSYICKRFQLFVMKTFSVFTQHYDSVW